MTLEDRVHLQRLRLFRRAEELGNVSAACREAGIGAIGIVAVDECSCDGEKSEYSQVFSRASIWEPVAWSGW